MKKSNIVFMRRKGISFMAALVLAVDMLVGAPLQVYAANAPLEQLDDSAYFTESGQSTSQGDDGDVAGASAMGDAETEKEETVSENSAQEEQGETSDAFVKTLFMENPGTGETNTHTDTETLGEEDLEEDDLTGDAGEAERIEINQTSASVYEGETLKLRATVYPAPVEAAVRWASSDKSIATVSKEGVVKGIAASDTPVRITAKVGRVSVVCHVKVLKSDVLEEDLVDEDGDSIYISDNIWVGGYRTEGFVYTGKTVKQDIRVYDKHKLLNEGKDYTVTYKNAVNAADTYSSKPPTAIIKMKGQYSGTKTLYYSIAPCPLEDVTIKEENAVLSYNGKVQKYKPTLTYNGKKLTNGKDYKMEWDKNPKDPKIDPWTEKLTYYNCKITAKGNYTGVKKVRYWIVAKENNLSKASITLGVKSVSLADGEVKAENLGILVKMPGSQEKVDPLADPENFKVELIDCDKVGNGIVRISPGSGSEDSGKTPYMGVAEKKFKITGYNIKNAALTSDWKSEIPFSRSLSETDQGIRQQKDGILEYDGKTLVEGTDYTVTYSAHKKVGKAKVVFKGIGHYSGSLTKRYKITARTDIFVPDELDPVMYTVGGAIPKLTVKDGDGNVLTEKKDYTVKLSNNKKVGTGTYTVKGKGNYAKAKKTGSFEIIPGKLSNCKVVVPDAQYNVKAGKFKSKPVLYDTNGKKLSINKDYSKKFIYSIEDSEAPEVGTIVRVTIEGAGNYVGSKVTGVYHIYDKKKSISKLYITIDKQMYTGGLIEPTLATRSSEDGSFTGDIHVYLTSRDRSKKQNEVEASKYVKIEGYKNNIKKGTGKVTLAAIGEYGGRKDYKFQIGAKSWNTNDIKTMKFTPNNVNLARGETKAVELSINPANADAILQWTFPETASFEFSLSEDKRIVNIKALDYGSCTLQVTSKTNGKSASCTVNCLREFNARDYGAIPDDGKPDNVAINDAIKAANYSGGGTVTLEPGTYDINPSSDYGNRCIIFWDCNNVELVLQKGTVLKAGANNKNDHAVIRFEKSKNCGVSGGKIDGNKKAHQGNNGEAGHCISVGESSNINISGMEICNGWGDGVYVGALTSDLNYSSNVTVSDCYIHHNRRNNISVTAAKYVTINDCELLYAGVGGGHDPQFGIDIETNDSRNPCEHIYLNRTIIKDNAKAQLGIITAASDIVLTDCELSGTTPVRNDVGANIKYVRTKINGKYK